VTYRAISHYFLKLNVAFFSHWRLKAHIPLHFHPEYWWGHSHWCPHQPKYWWGYVPGIPGGVDAYGPVCYFATCRPNSYRCENGQCVPIRYRCDGICDCQDLTDENGCPNNTTATGTARYSTGQGL